MRKRLFMVFCFTFVFLSCKGHNYRVDREKYGSGSTSVGEIKGMFVFGSSLVDNGNNDFLENKAKANYLPYGVDFAIGPTGRFTNGKNLIDFLGQHLHLPGFIPPFADPLTKGNKIVHGVNFASGGSGILDDTGLTTGRVYSLSEQIKNFEHVTLPELEAEMGCKSKRKTNSSALLSKYLFIVGAGGNDFTFNYFKLPSNLTLFLGEGFASHLVNALAHHLKKLYSLGGRKFVIMSVYPIGCTPMAKAFRPLSIGCVQSLNQWVLLFNARLKSVVDTLKLQMPGSTLVYVNQYKIIWDILVDPASYGFKDARNPCCDVGSLITGGNGVSCRRDKELVCGDRSSHVYFDGLHPTEAVNIIIANKTFSSYLQNEVYPINVGQLAKLV